MGRLRPQEIRWSTELGLLWEEIRDGTLVFHEPTPEEKAASRERRRVLFRNSHVPWILTDLGALLGGYDNLQDVVSFTNWNRKVYSPGAFRDCIEGRALKGSTGLAAAVACACPFGRSSKRSVASAGSGWGNLLNVGLYGAPIAAVLRFFPPVSGVMWGLLAGQVAMSQFGVGLRLGAIVGASQEVTYRALSAIGFPFGVDRNKYNQLQRAQVIALGDKLLGASRFLDAGDRVLAVVGLSQAYRDSHPIPETVVPLQDYPNTANLLSDPWGTIRAAASLASSLVPNAIAYGINDLVTPALPAISSFVGGVPLPPEPQLSAKTRAAMRAIHRQKCPREDACLTGVADYLRFLELLGGIMGDGLQARQILKPDGTTETVYSFVGPDEEHIALGVDDTIWGGLFRPVTAF